MLCRGKPLQQHIPSSDALGIDFSRHWMPSHRLFTTFHDMPTLSLQIALTHSGLPIFGVMISRMNIACYHRNKSCCVVESRCNNTSHHPMPLASTFHDFSRQANPHYSKYRLPHNLSPYAVGGGDKRRGCGGRGKNYILSSLRISAIFCLVSMLVGTRGRRRRFSMKPMSLSRAFTPAGLPSTKSRL